MNDANENQYIQSMSNSLESLSICSKPSDGSPKAIKKSPSKSNTKEEIDILEKGLSCLLSQLDRINDQLRYNNLLKQVIADYEEEYKRDLAASLAKSMVASSKKTKDDNSSKTTWVKYYDEEVEAEYFYNHETGEASWVDPNARR